MSIPGLYSAFITAFGSSQSNRRSSRSASSYPLVFTDCAPTLDSTSFVISWYPSCLGVIVTPLKWSLRKFCLWSWNKFHAWRGISWVLIIISWSKSFTITSTESGPESKHHWFPSCDREKIISNLELMAGQKKIEQFRWECFIQLETVTWSWQSVFLFVKGFEQFGVPVKSRVTWLIVAATVSGECNWMHVNQLLTTVLYLLFLFWFFAFTKCGFRKLQTVPIDRICQTTCHRYRGKCSIWVVFSDMLSSQLGNLFHLFAFLRQAVATSGGKCSTLVVF